MREIIKLCKCLFNKFLNYSVKLFHENRQQKLLDTSLNDMKRVAFIDSMISVIHSNMKNKNKFVHRVCKKNIWSNSLVVYYARGFYLTEEIDKTISIFQSSGILSYFVNRYVDSRYWNAKSIDKGLQRLSFQHLEGAFKLWIIVLFISSIIFVLEICCNQLVIISRQILYYF